MSKLELSDLTRDFPTRGEPLQVLKGVNLQVSAGETLAIVGPSGCGKSTLLHILGTLDIPTSGTMILDGTDPFQLDEQSLARFRNQNIGFIFQDHHLLPQLSVLENVLIPAIANGRPGTDCVERAHQLIERVGLSNRIEHRPAELSGGERERVAVARSLIHQPTLLLADEPTGNLDQANARQVGSLLLEMHEQEEMMLVVVTHSQELAAMLDRQYQLDNGKLVDP
ncbi:MAG: ABC transporter ATP-binding protein [Pirellulaceae bacterium]